MVAVQRPIVDNFIGALAEILTNNEKTSSKLIMPIPYIDALFLCL